MARAVRYEPYGRIRDEWGPEQDPEDAEFGATSELYGGKERRRDTFGLAGTIHELEAYDYGARLYLPELGRWGSADSVTPDLVWEANGFAFVRNNPLRYVDAGGRQSLSWGFCGSDGTEICQGSEVMEVKAAAMEAWNERYIDGPFRNFASTAFGVGRDAAIEAGFNIAMAGAGSMFRIARLARVGDRVALGELGAIGRLFAAAERHPKLVQGVYNRWRNDGPGEWRWMKRGLHGLENQAARAGVPLRQAGEKGAEILEYGLHGVDFDDFRDGMAWDYKDYSEILEKGGGGWPGWFQNGRAGLRAEAMAQAEALRAIGLKGRWAVGKDAIPVFQEIVTEAGVGDVIRVVE